MSTALPVSVVIINFRTPDITSRAVTSLRWFYPTVPLILIDNGSADGTSVRVLEELTKLAPSQTLLVKNPTNLHHGPAMDQAARLADTPNLLFFDSDCEVVKGGVVESMLSVLQQDEEIYAVGKRIHMDRRGYDLPEPAQDGIPYIRPICMMLRRGLYLDLPPFERHGAPCLSNMRRAAERGYRLAHFDIGEYVTHLGRGTASRFGYNLGWRGILNHLLHKLGL